MALKKMKYKDFTWTNNPYECRWECDRSFVRHKYPELMGAELEDFGPNAIVISGSGEFFGSKAYKTWNKLVKQFKKGGSGKFFHPIYKDVDIGLMTKLQSSLEPRENYIAYTFEIIADRNKLSGKKVVGNIVEEVKSTTKTTSTPSSGGSGGSTSSSSKSSTSSSFKVGDSVLVNGKMYATATGSSQFTEVSNRKMTITEISKSTYPFPYHVGSATIGWVKESQLRRSTTSAAISTSGNTVHMVKPNETLSGICAKYGISDWKSVASMNNIKNANNINIGDKIVIIKGTVARPSSGGIAVQERM